MKITRDQVKQAARDSTTLTQVARSLGIREKKLSGRTSGRLRALLPELDEILRTNRLAPLVSSTESPPQDSEKLSPDETNDPNPYRPGSMYNVLFREGAKGYWRKEKLITHVGKLVGKDSKLVAFQIPVLSRPQHSSNGNRSIALKDDQGRIKFVRCDKKRFHRVRLSAKGK